MGDNVNILLVNHYAGSPGHGMEYRPYYLAREWVRAGCQVTVAAASFSHLRIRQPEMRGEITEEFIDGIRFVWLKTPGYQGNGIQRLWNMLAFNRAFRRHEREVLGGQKPDVVIASSPHPFVVFPARRIARKNKARLVFEVRDLWPLSFTELNIMARWHPFVVWLQWTENFAYRSADRVVSVLPKTSDYMQLHGMAPEKFACIPNGVDIREWRQAGEPIPNQHAALIEKLKYEGWFIVGYLGQHAVSNALNAFVEAGPLLSPKKVAIVLVGQGQEKERLERLASRLNAGNTFFLPPVPRRSVPAALAAMDALFLGWNRSPLYRHGISPNKLMDYMMAGKPIIHAVDAGNDPVADSGCGVCCPPEDSTALANAVLRVFRLTPAERERLGQRGTHYVAQHHDYAILADHFLDVLSFDREVSET